MSAPSDGARADARKARAAGRERYVPEDATEALGWFIGAQRDQHPRLSTDMDSFDLAAAILASDWLAGVIADAKAEALREFVAWVATQRAFNGAGDPGQALYDYCLNAVLPTWAQEFIERESGR